MPKFTFPGIKNSQRVLGRFYFMIMTEQLPPELISENTFKQDKFKCLADRVSSGVCGDFVYCLHDGKFYSYSQGFWKALLDLEILSIIENGLLDNKKNKILTKFPFARRKTILDNLKLINHKPLESFNKSNLINLENYMVDVIGNNVLKHDKQYYSTIRLPYKYISNSKCELWLKTLNEILENDNEKIKSLQEYFGYCLTKDTNQIMALLLLGESKSGKSTLIHVLRHMIGIPNCSSVAMEDISNPQYTPLLINKLVNIDADVSEKSTDFEAQFKIITSGEPITCNQKFIPTFEFLPYCKIVMAANRFPRITDHSSAFYNRLLVIPCDRVFLPSEQDRTLKLRLLEELPGILLWSIQGLHRLNKRGMFEEKDFIREAREELREESNPVDVFFREHIEVDLYGNEQLEKGDIYIKYSEWCRKNGNAPMSSIKFGQSIYQKYSKFTPKKSQDYDTGKRVWKNLKYVDKKGSELIKTEVHWQEKEPAAVVIQDNDQPSLSKQQDINWEE